MTDSQTPNLQKAQDIARTAQVFAIIALVLLVVTIVFNGGFPIGRLIFADDLGWRERVNEGGVILIVPLLTLWVGERSGGFDINLEPESVGMLAVAFFISAIGRVLSAATQLKAENEAFV